MNQHLRLLVGLLLLTGLFSCQKEVVFPQSTTTTAPGGNNGGGNNGGGTNGGGTVTDSSYMPLVTGNWWKIKDSAAGTFQTETVTGSTITYNGHLFNGIYMQPSGSGVDTAYYGHDSKEYRFLALVGQPSVRLEYMYLRDTAVGTSWTTNAGVVNGFAVSASGQVIERDISKTVLGVTYQKVIHSYVELNYAGIGILARYNFYSAKGVGIIAVYTDAGLPGGPQSRIAQELDSYHVQ